ncbi:MAG TPA: hypothetical protein VMB82_06880, partial [Acidimicrobiales bacterium]|nr:hypothetical protein [Acidimicrobiales bacterium]
MSISRRSTQRRPLAHRLIARLTAVAIAVATSVVLAVGLAPLAGSGATEAAGSPQLPQLPAARQGAGWLAAQFNAQGFIPTTASSGTPTLSSTAQSVLALSAADVDLSTAARALSY